MEYLIDKFIKYNAQTNGKDKIFRACQYASKFIWWHLQKENHNSELVRKLKALESALSSTRKTLRLGKTVDIVNGIMKTLELNDTFLRNVLTVSKISQAVFLTVDHYLWAEKVGIVVISNKKVLSRISSQLWLFTLICNLIRDIHEIMNIISREKIRRLNQIKRHDYNKNNRALTINTTSCVEGNGEAVSRCLCENAPVFIDTFKNLADFFIPLANLNYLYVTPGKQGLLGTFTSLVAISIILKPQYKLSPA